LQTEPDVNLRGFDDVKNADIPIANNPVTPSEIQTKPFIFF
jgi:hypothetical protein